MIAGLSVREVTITEAEALLQLSRQTFFDAFAHLNKADDMAAFAGQAYTLPRFIEELSNPDSAFYFVLVDEQIAGYLKLNQADAKTELKDENSLEVERIYILKEFQGRQLGKYLIDFSVEFARSKGFEAVWLGVWENNHGAIRFYEKNGFTVFGTHSFMLGSDKQTDLLMRKSL